MLRDRLRENELVQANFILVLGNMIEERWTSEWWDDFSKTERGEFERTARDLVGRLAILRTLVTEGRRVVARQTEACRFAAQHSGTTSLGSN